MRLQEREDPPSGSSRPNLAPEVPGDARESAGARGRPLTGGSHAPERSGVRTPLAYGRSVSERGAPSKTTSGPVQRARSLRGANVASQQR